jgi:hypothetical protein
LVGVTNHHSALHDHESPSSWWKAHFVPFLWFINFCPHMHVHVSNIQSPVEIILSSTVMHFSALLALVFKFKSLYYIPQFMNGLYKFFNLILGLSCCTRKSGTVHNSLVHHSASTQTTFSFTFSSKIKKV